MHPPRGLRGARQALGGGTGSARADSRPVLTRRETDGGRSVAGHTARDVKKPGAVVSKLFVKVGGLFHD
jgi:hypothetical protein